MFRRLVCRLKPARIDQVIQEIFVDKLQAQNNLFKLVSATDDEDRGDDEADDDSDDKKDDKGRRWMGPNMGLQPIGLTA